jgi:hypothetical protein
MLKCELGLVKGNFKRISHLLTDFQKQQRVDIATELLHVFEGSAPQELSRLFSGAESWFFLDNARNSMWAASGVLRATRDRLGIGAQKVMLWICFSTAGIHDVVIPAPGRRFNRDFFMDEVLDHFDDRRAEAIKWHFSSH